MSIDRADPLRALRERIVELVAWFGEDGRRLPEAQDVWRQDQLWDRRLREEEERWRIAIAERARLPFASLSDPAPRLLLELECLDHVAWEIAGIARLAPAPTFRRGDREYYLVRLARERRPHVARQAGIIYTHLRYHALVPTRVECDAVRSYRVVVKSMIDGRRCAEAIDRGRVSVATTSFADDAPVDWNDLSIPTAEERGLKLSKAIADAAARGVDILVAPELTVTPSVRTNVLRTLQWAGGPQLALLVPGTFHEREDDAVFNRAILVDGKGNELCTHRKLTKFGLLEEGWLETIALGDQISVLVTPIGTVAIAICKDFCDDFVGRVWAQIQPEWLLVPAYGKGASAHETAAKRISRMVGTIIILAHEGDRDLDAPQNSFIHGRELVRSNSKAPDFFEYFVNLQDELEGS
jgi:hypothetical protein